MDRALQRLLELRFDEAPGRDANERIQQVRERLGGQKPAVSYEVLLPAEAGWEQFETKVLPRLVYHLECLGIRPPDAPGAFLSIFVGETLYFVHARDALALACERMGLDAEGLLKRFGTGELRTAIRPEPEPHRGPPLALPGPRGGDGGE